MHPAVLAAAAERVAAVEPVSVLDVGAALGASGALLREALDVPTAGLDRARWRTRIDAVLSPGVASGPQHGAFYDRLVGAGEGGVYDAMLVTAGPGLARADAPSALRALLARTRQRLVLLAPAEDEAPGGAWSLRDLRGLRADAAVLGPRGGRTLVASLAPPGVPRVLAPPEHRRALSALDALWDGPAPARRPLTVAYLVPHHHVTGGVKILLEHVARLRGRGHRVRAVARGRMQRALPPWSDVRADEEAVLPPGAPLAPALLGADVALAGWYDVLPELAAARAPAVYFEQGHEILYGDTPDTPAGRALVDGYEHTMLLPLPCVAVSPFAASVVQDRFGRRCGVVPNGIDALRFRPGARPRQARVLLVGNAALAFKGFDVALRALALAARELPGLSVTWVTQVRPQLEALPFPLQLVVDPPQAALPDLYRAHDLFLSASWYESFPLPPLEAMASGLPVVATRCGGLESYARDGENCLLAPGGDAEGLGRQVVRALSDPALSQRLARASRATAEACSWDRALDALEEALGRVARGASAAARQAR